MQSVPEVQTDMTVFAFSWMLRRIWGGGRSSAGVVGYVDCGGEVGASPLTRGSVVAKRDDLVVSVRR